MFEMSITPISGNMYRIRVFKKRHESLSFSPTVDQSWSIEVDEIDLDETVAKVLRVSKNLRELPSS